LEKRQDSLAARLKAGDHEWKSVGERPDVFSGRAFGVYVPCQSGYRITTEDEVEIAVCKAPSHLICPFLDARKKEVYTALYRYRTTPATPSAGASLTPASEQHSTFPLPIASHKLEKLTDNLVLPLDELLSKIDDSAIFLGDALGGYRNLIKRKLKEKASFAPSHLNFPRAANVAILGLEKLKTGEKTDLRKIEPLYVRRPEAEVKWKEKHPD